jgi:hypothetical protein
VGHTNDPTGEAKSWIDDCLARGESPKICFDNKAVIDYRAPELWFIDVWGSAPFSGFTDNQKLIIVNTGCSKTGCHGRIGYNNGWPHPLQWNGESGPSACPDGILTADPPWETVAAVYCYTSLQNAAVDHKLPPFVQLSTAGWAPPP